MTPAEKEQIKTVIKNFHEAKQYIPFFSDLLSHTVFGPIFTNLEEEQQEEVKFLIKQYTSAHNKVLWKVGMSKDNRFLFYVR